MRITGSKDNLAVIADAERGRGRPQKAIDMFADANRNDLSKDIWLELAIVAAGAHSDLGDLETARKTIEDVGFTGHKPASAIRLLQAYADLLRVSGDSETADKYDKLAQVTAERTGLTDASEEVDIIVIEEELEDEAADDKQTGEDRTEEEQAAEAASDDEPAGTEPAEDVPADSASHDAGAEKDEEAEPAAGDDKSEATPADDGPVPVAEGNTLEDEINEEMAEIMADIDAAQEQRNVDEKPESEDAEAKHQPSVDDEPEPGDTPPMFDL